jgi:hypothetical protein
MASFSGEVELAFERAAAWSRKAEIENERLGGFIAAVYERRVSE